MSYNEPQSGLTASKLIMIAAALGAIGAIGYYLVKNEMDSKHDIPTPIPLQQAISPEPIKPIEKPVYTEPKLVLEPLPELNQSDAAVINALKNLNINGLVEMVIPEEAIRKFVRAVDAVEDGKVVTEYRPIKSPQGAFAVDSFNVKVSTGEVGEMQDAEQFRISPKNYLRYTLYVQTLSALESDAAITTYKRFYPLLNKAYKELGIKKDNFHSVLIRAIDKVLAAPEASGNIMLVHPKVYYEFADPALEKLSEVDKLMLRMGPDNASRVKASLANIRAKILQN